MSDRHQLPESVLYSDKWAFAAFEESEDPLLRALSRAWREADYIPQNMQQYRAAIIEPAIRKRFEELQAKAQQGQADHGLVIVEEAREAGLVGLTGALEIQALERFAAKIATAAAAQERLACAKLVEAQHTWITSVAASVLIRNRSHMAAADDQPVMREAPRG